MILCSIIAWHFFPLSLSGDVVLQNPNGKLVPDASNQAAPSQPQQVAIGDSTSAAPTETDTTQGITFKYPKDISLFHSLYVRDAKFPWPPRIIIRNENFTCAAKSLSPSNHITVTPKNVNGHTYCVSRSTEGAAGSTYETYNYTTMVAGKSVTASFIMFGPTNCSVYDNGTGNAPDNQTFNSCQKELSTYSTDLDNLIAAMMQSVTFN